MKLLKLTIHNIASIEDAVLDFENGPLAEDTRFLICGRLRQDNYTGLHMPGIVQYDSTAQKCRK